MPPSPPPRIRPLRCWQSRVHEFKTYGAENFHRTQSGHEDTRTKKNCSKFPKRRIDRISKRHESVLMVDTYKNTTETNSRGIGVLLKGTGGDRLLRPSNRFFVNRTDRCIMRLLEIDFAPRQTISETNIERNLQGESKFNLKLKVKIIFTVTL